MPDKAALVIIFNHRYDKNIPILEEVYRHRFSNIYYLVPFYDGDKSNVIPVYGSSWQFQGYIAQGFKSFFKEEFCHYIFAGDDLILNPAIDESNYREHFKLDSDASFIPEVFAAHHLHNTDTLRFQEYQAGGKKKLYWGRLRDFAHYKHHMDGAENAREVPSYAEAEAALKEHGYPVRPLKFREVYGPNPRFYSLRHAWTFLKWLLGYRRAYKPSYPMVLSYSDIAVVSKSAIRKFAKYCGVFAANGLFVELALPTALLLSSKRVVTEPTIGKRGGIYWPYTEREKSHYAEAMKPYGKDLHRLLENFPAHQLYIHPIKLSQWTF